MVSKAPDFQPVLIPVYSGMLESGYKNRADAINSGGKLTWHMNYPRGCSFCNWGRHCQARRRLWLLHALIWRGEFLCIAYSAHFLKGKGNSGQENRSFLWVRAHPNQVTTLCDSLCPEESQRGQKRKHASPTGCAWIGVKGTWMWVRVCTGMCVLPQEGKPVEGETQEAEDTFKGLASRENIKAGWNQRL